MQVRPQTIRPALRPGLLTVAVLPLLLVLSRPCLAASGPFGVASPDVPQGMSWGMNWTGPFSGLMVQAMQAQSYFYTELTGAVDHFSASPGAVAWLVGLSLLYGVFHAVGPGHGKAVISSYLLSTHDSLRRAVLISFAASLMQALVAIGIVAVGTLLLNVTAANMAGVTDMVAIASYTLIAMIGLMLLVTRLRRAFGGPQPNSSGLYLCEEVLPDLQPGEGMTARIGRGWRRLRSAVRHIHTASCGCVPVNLGYDKGEVLPWPRLLPLIASVGIRPCSGALIVLVFALSGGLLPAGILSVLAMALGTGATITLIAVLSVVARSTLMRAASVNSAFASRVSLGLQLAASALILIFGLTMMTGALAMHAAG